MKYSSRAIVNNEFQLGTEARLQLSVDQPNSPYALPPGVVGKQATARIRWALGQLFEMNVENLHKWIGQVAETSPSAAANLMLELAQFHVPKVKAVAVEIREPDALNPRRLSFDDLQRLVSEQ